MAKYPGYYTIKEATAKFQRKVGDSEDPIMHDLSAFVWRRLLSNGFIPGHIKRGQRLVLLPEAEVERIAAMSIEERARLERRDDNVIIIETVLELLGVTSASCLWTWIRKKLMPPPRPDLFRTRRLWDLREVIAAAKENNWHVDAARLAEAQNGIQNRELVVELE